MNHLSAHLVFLTLTIWASLATGQSFPIVPLSEPIYPSAEPEFNNFDIDRNNHGTMQRIGDINNDGRDDLVVIFINDNRDLDNLVNENACWIYISNEDGTFAKPYPLDVALSTNFDSPIYDFTIHDHNADGFADIIIAMDVETATLLGSPNGFTQGEYFSQGIREPRVLYTDTNGDNYDDLVIWSPVNLDITIRLNAGDAGYIQTPIPQYLINTYLTTKPDVRFSDFDGDGDVDILITNGFEVFWLEKVNGFYKEPIQWNIDPINFTPSGITVLADVNADNLTDVVLQGYNPEGEDGYGFYLGPFSKDEIQTISYFSFPDFENERSADFVQPDQWKNLLYSPGDLDGDGTDDLILKPYPQSDIAWRITDPLNHNGRFGISNEIDIHGDGSIEAEQYPIAQYNNNDAYIDINNDGALDRIVPASAHAQDDLNDPKLEPQGVALWAVLGNPFMPGTIFNEQDTIRANDIHVHYTHADLDYDGEPEILITPASGSIRTLRRDLNDDWSYDQTLMNTAFSDNATGFRTIATQLDSDQCVELVSLKAQDSFRPMPAIFLNVDVPAYGEQYRPDSLNRSVIFEKIMNNFDVYIESGSSSFAVDDIDSDGDNDIVIRGQGGYKDSPDGDGEAILAWLNDGEANFTPGPLSIVNAYWEVNTHTIELLDHNNDGYPDLIIIESDQSKDTNGAPVLAVYENDGQGNFLPTLQIPLFNLSGGLVLRHYWIEVNDLDLDGYNDIQVLTKNLNDQSEVVVLYGSASGISTKPVFFSGAGAAEVHSADLDGNGLLDIYTCSYESNRRLKNSISIMFQTAPRVFLPAVSINDIDMSAVDALDMNRDGAMDLIGGDSTEDDLRVIYSVPQLCPADLNLDRVLNFFDISLFLTMYTQERPLADLNHDGSFNFFDVSALFQSFQEGCP